MKVLMPIILVSALGVTGCSTLNEEFDCPAPKGGTCKRMDEVYEAINGRHQFVKEAVPHKEKGSSRIWVSPYEDINGNFHPGKAVYSNLQED